MPRDLSTRINELFEQENWAEAQRILEKKLKREPKDHWLLTQLAAAHYEQKDYEKALELLMRSKRLAENCPLTLWHLAGTYRALGERREALSYYLWLYACVDYLQDPCWESPEWASDLKKDCKDRMDRLLAEREKKPGEE